MNTRSSTEQLTPDEIKGYIDSWLTSAERERLLGYKTYYESKNEKLAAKVKDRFKRGKTPNYFIPTAYYSTLVDTMAGYLFQNIKYIAEEDESEELLEVLKKNAVEIKDMTDGTHALTYNRGIEYVYTEGTPENLKYKFTPIPTESVILIFNTDIEPKMFAAIRFYDTDKKGVKYLVDVIYKDELVIYEYIEGSDNQIKEVVDSRKKLLFTEVPIVLYNTEIISILSSFNCVLPYIEALDWLITGNTNEIDRLVDALLVLGKKVKPEDLEHTDEWKLLQDYKTEDRAEYLSKEMSPEFREYVSQLLIQEIHKHSHVIDWYSPDSGLSGAVSGKALKTRLFDMDMFSQRIEKVYRIGSEKRLRLLSELLGIAEREQGEVKIIFNRTLPSDIEEKISALNQATFISDETKFEILGLDWEKELVRREAQKKRNGVEIPFELEPRTPDA